MKANISFQAKKKCIACGHTRSNVCIVEIPRQNVRKRHDDFLVLQLLKPLCNAIPDKIISFLGKKQFYLHSFALAIYLPYIVDIDTVWLKCWLMIMLKGIFFDGGC